MRNLVSLLSLLTLTSTSLAGVVSGSGMVVLDTSASGALSLTGSSEVDVPANSIYVNSSSSTAVKTTGSTPNLYICGGFSFSGGSHCTGTVHNSVAPYAGPMSGLAFPNTTGMTSRTLSASGNSTITAQPGYYPNGITVTGSLTGSSGVGGGPKMGDLIVAKQVSLTGSGGIRIGNPTMPAVELPVMPLFD